VVALSRDTSKAVIVWMEIGVKWHEKENGGYGSDVRETCRIPTISGEMLGSAGEPSSVAKLGEFCGEELC